ncbi:hypothetical protein BZA05DRAFT_23485 [Tricharina praecox]|uniref:uncharacterized protein n=1 Tax=Tricharina praecox TaxID=43433 RepID=UPI00221E3936|nr:uncharacterized protein BZA05DRAFT_23485 [Tricharina praecox]KAI5859181.1 hypothetical protein BZA05DRAFT_23485 [Tricharina praecox]
MVRVRRWMCCKCGNSWMVVKDSDDANICSYSECQHERCTGCTTVMMNVPMDPAGITPICRPIPDQIHLPQHHHQNEDDEEDVEERPSIHLPTTRPRVSHMPHADDGAEATIPHGPSPTSRVCGDHDLQARG